MTIKISFIIAGLIIAAWIVTLLVIIWKDRK
jgi:hypothetical protein